MAKVNGFFWDGVKPETVGKILNSRATQKLVNDAADEIAAKATAMSGEPFKRKQSKNPRRASAAVLPDSPGAANKDRKDNVLIRSM